MNKGDGSSLLREHTHYMQYPEKYCPICHDQMGECEHTREVERGFELLAYNVLSKGIEIYGEKAKSLAIDCVRYGKYSLRKCEAKDVRR